ncbi:putative uncharacterized protein DDB_G0279653 [Drosophila ficusphila]|uniref:putative uncharacterized protein DDB_G0279653 n=1 Tax=Drosophila ficusphila TaxID=30025 RepID=UPI001C895B83|nr:putative uncharacterized protein DDB_G0279653 [Drosophila ficusphila]
MFLLGVCLLFIVNPLLLKAYPVAKSDEPGILPAPLSEPADYPDLTNGLSDDEVQESLQDLTLDDLNSLDKLLDEHSSQDEDADTDASLRTQSRRAKANKQKQGFDSWDSEFDDGCRDDEDSDDPRPNQCTKRPNCQTTKRYCKKPTCPPKTTRACNSRPSNDNCKQKSNGYMDDDMTPETTKCPKPKPKKCKKPKDDLECDADDFLCHAMKRERLKAGRRNHQEDKVAPDALAEYVPGRELAGIEQLGEQILPAFNDQGEPIDESFDFESVKLEQSGQPDIQFKGKFDLELKDPFNAEQEQESKLDKRNQEYLDQEHQSSRNNRYAANLNVKQKHRENFMNAYASNIKQDNLKNLDQENVVNLKDENGANGDYSQENLKQENQELNNLENVNHEYWSNMKLDSQKNLDQERQVNVKNEYSPNVELDKLDNFDQNNENLKQYYSSNAKLDNHEMSLQKNQESLKHEYNLEPENHQNFEQENVVKLKHEDQANFGTDFESHHGANLEQGQVNFDHESQSNFDEENQSNNHQANFVQEHQSNLERERNLEQDNQANLEMGNQYNFERKQQFNIDQEHQESFNNENLANLHPNEQQIFPDQKDSSMEGVKQVVEVPAPLNSYDRNQYSRIASRKRKQSEALKESSHNEDEKKEAFGNDEHIPLNPSLKKQEPLFDSDSFIANNARDPPRYLIQMQNDYIKSENDNGERRLREDRSQSEALNLDHLTDEESSPIGDLNLKSNYKRSKRENKESDDAPENSKETYIKKLMDSFPRDQGGQINANAALRGSNLAHLRIKRS